MKYADEKYKTLLQKGTWNALDTNEEKILVLQVEINNLKSGKKNKQGGGKSEAKNPKSSKKEKPRWFSKRPEQGELSTPREWNGMMWYYCDKDTGRKCDGRWRQHKPSQCKGKAHQFIDTRNQKDEKKNLSKRKFNDEKTDAKNKRALKLKESVRAVSAIVNNSDEMTSSDEN